MSIDTDDRDRRISFNEGLDLLKHAPLEELQKKAIAIRNKKNPPDRVTFVLDSNPNYTNVCNIDCSFCAFYRKKSAKDAYTKSIEEVMLHLEKARKAGIKTVLLQGGVNDDLKIDYFVSLVREARLRYPEIFPHFFTAVEIWNAARVSNITVKEAFQRLWDAGQRTLPGGGAEILSERVRLQISPKKIGPNGWIEVHKTAHEVGFRSTATMMYGHVEDEVDVLNHLETLRQAQDETGGFMSFVPWSYKPNRTALRRTVKHWIGPDAYYRILALSRIYLDNFDHIQASWFGETKEIGINSLKYGADDFGGTLFEENVHRATGWINKVNHNHMLQMIRAAGYEPVQRDSLFKILMTYEGIDQVEIPAEQEVTEDDQIPYQPQFE